MEKKGTVHHISSKKRGRPKIRFNIGILIIIISLTFIGFFALYMIAANKDDDFLGEDESSSVVQEQSDDAEEDSTNANGETSVEPAQSQHVNEIVNPVPQSEAVDESYFESCCLITDSTLLEMAGYASFSNILGNADINASNCNDTKVVSSFGTFPPYDAVQLIKPANIYIMLGSDIGTSSVDDMIAAYTTMLSNIHNYLPDSKIYVMQLPPVAYDAEPVTNALINEYNSRLLDMAKNANVCCIDTNTALRSAEGTLAPEYWDSEVGKLSPDAYKVISDYIRTHTI